MVALVARADWASPNGTIVTSWLVTKAFSAWVRSEAAANENHRMISLRQNHCMSSSGPRIGMRRCILVVAQQIELRARIARVLQSAGYAVELAESQKRARELAAGGRIEAAIIVVSTDLASLSEKLRDKVPRTILLGRQTDEVI